MNSKHSISKKAILIAVCIVAVAAGVTYFVTSSAKDATINEMNEKLNALQQKIDDYEKGTELGKEQVDKLKKHNENIENTESEALTPETATQVFETDGVIVVNKKHPVPESYAPYENPEAVEHLKELIAEAQNSGIDLDYSWSGFRSYDTQAGLFNSYAASSGVEAAETFSARPGYSEHQTGLAFDLKASSGALYRIDDASYDYNTDWVAQHAADFGFIIRYREEWQDTTGYIGEPWHLRYLGADLANKVYEANEPLETYLGVEGGNYN
ncbi:MAG: M15 family metallopeptidase [Bifidobacteriaceae bacterium]|jgi:LAS superfamily LD-carboxypeptidase LdcB|nr:M15 family metallopeptidase [Bifidobacteriaceae bacterium]